MATPILISFFTQIKPTQLLQKKGPSFCEIWNWASAELQEGWEYQQRQPCQKPEPLSVLCCWSLWWRTQWCWLEVASVSLCWPFDLTAPLGFQHSGARPLAVVSSCSPWRKQAHLAQCHTDGHLLSEEGRDNTSKLTLALWHGSQRFIRPACLRFWQM